MVIHFCIRTKDIYILNSYSIYNINLQMSKQQSAPANETNAQQPDKTNPFDKLIAFDQLIYLPNLYLRQYKAMDELVRLRQDFPQQRLLLQRPYTKWDGLLDEMRFRAKVVQEEKKYKIVQRSQNAKYIKLEVQRSELRSEQNYQYHRLISSHLSEGVLNLFQQQSRMMVEQPKQEIKEEQHKATIIKRQDDIFVEGENDYDYMPEENNLLDDLLNDPIVEKKEEYIEREEVYIQPISTFLMATYLQNRNEIDKQPKVSISRKTSLRRINQNVRKRLKIKQQQEEQPGRSLSSATVFLSNLLNTEAESRSLKQIQLPSKTQWLFSSERPRKRKDDDTFQLRWSNEQIQKFEQRNERYNIRKGKIDNNILVMTINNDEEEYKKYFEKNISSDKYFPPTLQNIPKLEVEKTKKYYNEFHDIEYEKFIRKYNKRSLFKKFSSKSSYLFPQNYSHDQFEDNESINPGKMFVHPPEKVLDRIIYKISDYKLGVSVKNQFSHIRMDLNQMIILAFFARKYIKKFGNDWKSITKFIEMNPIFSNHHITQQIVQQVYQLVSKYQDNDTLGQINLWDKKILPFDYYGCYSYAEFDEKLYKKSGAIVSYMQGESSETDDDLPPFDFDRYEQMIKEKPETPKLEELKRLEKEYKEYGKSIFQNMCMSDHNFVINRQNKYQKINAALQKFQESQEKVQYVCDDRDKRQSVGKVLQEVLSFSKGGDIKPAYAFRKKKNINQRNNELVKILQALRNKNVSAPNPNIPKKPEDTKPFTGSNAAKPAPPSAVPASTAAKQSQTNPEQKKPAIQRSPEKPQKQDKKLGAPPKKDRKSKDNDDKKG